MTEPMQRGSGTFRIFFDDAGNATSVDTVQSTGFELLDRSATTTLKRWKTIPGRALTVLVPITFEPDAPRPVPKPKHSP
jgi:TonB family protein